MNDTLPARHDGRIVFAPFFQRDLVDAYRAQVLDLRPVDLIIKLAIKRSDDGIVTDVLFQADVFYRTCGVPTHRIPNKCQRIVDARCM